MLMSYGFRDELLHREGGGGHPTLEFQDEHHLESHKQRGSKGKGGSKRKQRRNSRSGAQSLSYQEQLQGRLDALENVGAAFLREA